MKVHQNAGGLVYLLAAKRGTVLVHEARCPWCQAHARKELTEDDWMALPDERKKELSTYLSFRLDGLGKVLSLTNLRCDCPIVNCRECTQALLRTLGKSQLSLNGGLALRVVCNSAHPHHHRLEEEWKVDEELLELFFTYKPNSKRRRTSDGGGSSSPAFASSGRVSDEEARKRMLDDIMPGLERGVRQVATDAAKEATSEMAMDVLELHQKVVGVLERLAALDKFKEEMEEIGTSVDHFVNGTTGKRKHKSGGGHLGKAATAEDLISLRWLRDSEERVEAIVAARQVGRHFEISLDTNKVFEKDSSWMLMVTGIHHIAFAAHGDLDPSDPDVFSVEDLGGVQRVLISDLQTLVRDDQRFMVPSRKNDGRVLLLSEKEIVEQGRQREVVGVRMGNLHLSCMGRRMTVCYSQAGFYSADVMMASIQDSASADKAAADAWRRGSAKRSDRWEEEMTQTKERVCKLEAVSESNKELIERWMVEQAYLKKLQESQKMEQRRLAERYERETADREEVERVANLQEQELREELMAEKQRGLLQRKELQLAEEALGRKDAAVQVLEVKLAAGVEEWKSCEEARQQERKATEAARQAQTKAESEAVQFRCTLEDERKEKDGLAKMATALQLQKEAVEEEKNAVEEAKEALEQEKKALTEALDVERKVTAEAKKETEQLKAEVTQLAADVEVQRGAVATLQSEKQAVEQEKVAVEQEKEAVEQEKERLTDALEAERGATTEAKKETALLKAEVTQLAADVEQQKGAAAALQSEMETVEQEKEAVQQEKGALAAQLTAQKTATAEAEATAVELRKAAEEAEAAVALLPEETQLLLQLHQAVLRLVEDAGERGAVREALEGSVEELTVTLPNETEANGEECARLCRLLLTQCPELRQLCLQSETFGKSIEGLKDGLKQHGGLQYLQLFGNVTDAAAWHLASALETNECLLRLYLGARLQENVGIQPSNEKEDAIGDKGAVLLANALQGSNTLNALQGNNTLRMLWLGFTNIGNKGAEALATALRSNKSLQVLVIEKSNIDCGGAKHLAGESALKMLCLHRCNVGDTGAEGFANALKANNTLRRLALGWPHINATVAKSLAGALQGDNRALVSLYLYGKIGVDDAQLLAKALQQNGTLQELCLWDGNLGDKGAQHLALALQQSTALQLLSMGNCGVGDAAAGHLASALEKNKGLRELNLRHSKVGQKGADLLAAALQKKKGTFTSLLLPEENFDEGQQQHLRGIDARIHFG